jgi:putative membrane protein
MLGLYFLSRGLGITETLDTLVSRARNSLYAGRVTIITYLVAGALLVIGGVDGLNQLEATQMASNGTLGALEVVAALVQGSVQWFAAAGITTSLGQITDEYLADRLEWRYLNAPFYVLSIAIVLDAVSSFFLGTANLSALAAALTGGTLLGLVSTLVFAIAESRFPRETETERDGEPV